jgi:hypothetical protein
MITGLKGAGKTAYMTKLLYDAWKKGRTVRANYKLEFPFKAIDLDFLLTNPYELQDMSIGIDEAQTYFDCRMSASKKNRIFSYLMLQSRKRHVDIFFTSQQAANVDIRIRRNIDFLYECTPMVQTSAGLKRARLEDIEGKRIARILITEFNFEAEQKKKFIFNPTEIYKIYDSDEFINIDINS